MEAFPIIFALGVMAGLAWLGMAEFDRSPPSARRSEAQTAARRVDAGLVALASGLVGARLGFVLLHWPYYASRPVEALWLWQGGLTLVGGVVGAAISLVGYALGTKRPLWRLLDHLAPPILLLAFALWIACQIDGCAYGKRMVASPWAPTSPDLLGAVRPRWPTQAVGAVGSLLILVLLYALRQRLPTTGSTGSLGLLLIGMLTLALAFTRADPVAQILGLRADVVGAGVIAWLGGMGIIVRYVQTTVRRSDG